MFKSAHDDDTTERCKRKLATMTVESAPDASVVVLTGPSGQLNRLSHKEKRGCNWGYQDLRFGNSLVAGSSPARPTLRGYFCD